MIALRRACTAGSRFVRPLFSILLLAGVVVAGDAMATTYRIVALTIPADAKYGAAFDINATGDVVGTITTGDNKVRTVEWSPPDYAMRVMPLPPDLESSVMNGVAINAAGDILGTNYASGDEFVGVVWKADGSFERLAMTTPQGQGTVEVYTVMDISNHGTVIGGLFNGDKPKPAIWTNPQTLRVLLAVPRGTIANAVNDSGVIVGGLLNSTFFKHGFRWTRGGGVLDLGDLAGGGGFSGASDVNDSGQIVGYSTASDVEDLRAVLWDADGTIHDLGHLAGGNGTQGYEAYRINNFGEVLGNGDGQNWLWTAGAGMLSIDSMIDPNDPLRGYGGIDMHALNDAGVVVGGLVNYTIRTIPVMLVPQP